MEYCWEDVELNWIEIILSVKKGLHNRYSYIRAPLLEKKNIYTYIYIYIYINYTYTYTYIYICINKNNITIKRNEIKTMK